MSLESREFVDMREGQQLEAAYESERHQRPIERPIGSLCNDGAGRVGVCMCCGGISVIGHAMHVCSDCSTIGGDV